MKKRKLINFKLIFIIIGVLGFCGSVFGLTYAWYTWQSNPTVLSGESACFNIDYVSGSNISGILLPTTAYNAAESKNTTIKMNMNPACVSTSPNGTCTIQGTATIQLITTPGACSNVNYTTSSTCTANGGTWTGTDEVMLNGALKYDVYQGTVLISSGSIIQDENNSYMHVLGSNIPLSTVQVPYTIYLWLDKNTVSNNYIDSKYDGTIKVVSVQIPCD